MTGRPRDTWVAAIPTLALAAGLALLAGGTSDADRLVVPAEAPAILHLGAAVLLYTHIGGGAVGLLAGYAAILLPKGKRWHRQAGRIFFVAMFVSFVVATGVAPFLDTGQRPNTIAACSHSTC